MLRWAAGCFVVSLLRANPYAGSAACSECHASIARTQGPSHHAQALRPIRSAPLYSLLAGRGIRERGGYTLDYRASGDVIGLAVSREEDRAEAVIEWAFGAGTLGFTPVGRRGEVYFEHRISWYVDPARLGVTPGHALGGSSSAAQAVGLDRTPDEAFRCFNCHAAQVRKTPTGVDLSHMENGVRCERCHGPGQAHIDAARQKLSEAGIRRTVLNSGRFPAKSSVLICGECHRTPTTQSDMPEIEDPVSVRFQPIGLMASRCFQKSGKLSCLTCHNPHENAVRADGAFYSARCAGCHTQPAATASVCKRGTAANCLPCHMRQSTPAPYLTFTDHRIRVYLD